MLHPRLYVNVLRSHFQTPISKSALSHLHRFSTGNSTVFDTGFEFRVNEATEPQLPDQTSSSISKDKPLPEENGFFSSSQVSHPWRELVDLIDKLMKNGYFGEFRNPHPRNGELGQKEVNLIRTSCLNFARHQHRLIRYLSREDILVIVGSSCPSVDRKVVNSGKRLRAHLGCNEENVCRSCIMRGDCDRAYAKIREDKGGRTVDVMRILLAYGLDSNASSLGGKPCLDKNVTDSVRKLLKDMVINMEDHDSKLTPFNSLLASERNAMEAEMYRRQDEWRCPKCSFHNLARNNRCVHCDYSFPQRLRKIVEEEQLPLKKGDWICKKCNFLNFSRNTRCLQCKEKPSNRHLKSGEWECESCNYLNFRRNMKCLKCDHKRPIALNATGNAVQNTRDATLENQAQLWFEQEDQIRDRGHKSLDFVRTNDEDRVSSVVWNNNMQGFVDFPMVGGKSEVSRDTQKHELWRTKMAIKNAASRAHPMRENMEKFNSSMSRRLSEYLKTDGAIDDDEDDKEMAVWFGSGRKHGN